MKIRIRYFASLREVVGLSEETIELPVPTSIATARAALLTRYPRLQSILERSVYAVNRTYVPEDTLLQDNDELVFIPPTGGGAQCNH